MNTTGVVVATGVIVIGGRWANGDPVDVKIGVGFGVYALMLSLLTEANPKLAGQFSILVLVMASFRYAVPVAQKLGLVGNG